MSVCLTARLRMKKAERIPISTQFAHVVRNVKEGTPPLVKAEEALVVQRIVDAIYESGETGRMVELT